ncbi:hypothetical protein TNCV_556451 [Trichonephila clavipes]|uniref:Uncharacterized protein n=1 Tax=Trichonephila clavipes TaxID=2585209 RepID=A0A8X6RVD1_TRICX|nr:hypothetical protein TNCV_556451 [Trichonephila clavipes]
MNRCPDLVVCLKRDLQCLRPEASLVLIYRPNVAGMKGRVDLAQPVYRTPDHCLGHQSLPPTNLGRVDQEMGLPQLGGHYTLNAKALKTKYRTATAGSDVVQSGRPIFEDFFQHLWPYIGNNTADVVFQMVKRLWLIRIDQ